MTDTQSLFIIVAVLGAIGGGYAVLLVQSLAKYLNENGWPM